MIDIHTHIIPFVDDGSSSLQESLEMVKKAVSIGVKTMIATPHHIYKRYEKSVEEITKNFNLLKEEVEKLNLPINLLLGQEIYYTSKENIIEKLNSHELLTINDSKYVLLEFSFTHKPKNYDDVIYNFKVNGYQVIIAHIERYRWIKEKDVVYFKNEGALIQVNAASLLGKEGFKIKRLAKKLIKHNLVDFIASDTHSFRESKLDVVSKKIKNKELFNKNLFESEKIKVNS